MVQYTRNLADQFVADSAAVGWPWKLLLFSFFVATFASFVFLGMRFGYDPYLRSRVGDLNKEIEGLGLAVSEEDRSSFIVFYSQVINISQLLQNHVRGKSFFHFLEETTNKKIYYRIVELSTEDGFIRLDGIADSYDSIVEQLMAFDQSPVIANSRLESSQVIDEGVRFNIRLVPKPELLGGFAQNTGGEVQSLEAPQP